MLKDSVFSLKMRLMQSLLLIMKGKSLKQIQQVKSSLDGQKGKH
jgi:hypothetical protein